MLVVGARGGDEGSGSRDIHLRWPLGRREGLVVHLLFLESPGEENILHGHEEALGMSSGEVEVTFSRLGLPVGVEGGRRGGEEREEEEGRERRGGEGGGRGEGEEGRGGEVAKSMIVKEERKGTECGDEG